MAKKCLSRSGSIDQKTDVRMGSVCKFLRIQNTDLPVLLTCLYLREFFNLFKTRWAFSLPMLFTGRIRIEIFLFASQMQ
jgi:hypothetical protein